MFCCFSRLYACLCRILISASPARAGIGSADTILVERRETTSLHSVTTVYKGQIAMHCSSPQTRPSRLGIRVWSSCIVGVRTMGYGQITVINILAPTITTRW
ncbi:hypothetical protein BGY98DRAFT_983030 [Russula aff. rugulosa BPL654]|nr:hypothetical protein BGY98DRAFT_983030 [Russula aff. rugulosa BPL654]